MCDVLILGDVDVLKGWFDGSFDELPPNWALIKHFDAVLAFLKSETPKLILVGDRLLKGELRRLRDGVGTRGRVVVVSDHFDANRFQLILEWGAEDLWITPIDCRKLDQNLQISRLGIQTPEKERLTGGLPNDEMIVGTSHGMVVALKTASLVAKTDATVLVRGESGTGKELLARKIHALSGRSGQFVALNCAAVSEGVAESELFGHERGAFTGAVSQRQGCFEQAEGGTLFLDEVGDASAAFQAKLLRVLERNEFMRVGGERLICTDVRVIAATNNNLEAAIGAGDFRLDLHYRLGAVTLFLPPLRERRNDLPEIVGEMVCRLNQKLHRSIKGVSRQAVELMMAYDWPGNLRELYHVLHRAMLLCRRDIIEVECLQGLAERGTQEDLVTIQTLDEMEEAHIARVLDITSGNRGRACALLGISRPTLRRKMRRYAMPNDAVPA